MKLPVGSSMLTPRRCGPRDPDRGSNSLSLVILAPVVIVLLLLVVAFGRYAYSRQLVEQASAAAARAASLAATSGQAQQRAQSAAAASLSDAGVSCRGTSVQVDADFRPGGTVTVTVSCTADLTDLALAGVPGSTTVTSSSSSIVESYRQVQS
jgi:Flp pilus assembly protein TadG